MQTIEYNKNHYLPEGCRIGTAANREATASFAALERAMAEGAILEGVATLCDHGLNLHVSVGAFQGFIPREEVAFQPDGEAIKDIAIISRVGKPICFRVIGVMQDAPAGEPQLLLSRRLAQRECYRDYISSLLPGDIIPARVTHLESFGAFVDIGCGVVSLLSVDCISVSRIRHPSDRLYAGMLIRTVVKTLDRERERVYVSMRELLGTWEENAADFTAGQTVTGVIRSVEPYGVFVELAPNLAGLTELRDELRAVAHQYIGQSAAVFIKSICPERMKIKLVLIDTYPDVRRCLDLKYYIPEGCEHMDRWVYSPQSSPRRIETVFTNIE
ncbi:MAG: 30S ribosomal protein S1 [Clostridia bacterium]|nr:30S ribosomal protein S1 [Clostridia bacterium]